MGPAGPVSDAFTCTPFKPKGAACTPGYQECNVLSYCGDDGTCVNEIGHTGDPCGTLPSGEVATCDLEYYCDVPYSRLSSAMGTCQPGKVPGDACDGDTAPVQCSGGTAIGYCDRTDINGIGTCRVCEL
jgi:hypothetical protein